MTVIMKENIDGSRMVLGPEWTPAVVDKVVASGKFRFVLNTDRMIVIALKGRHHSPAPRNYYYGGRTTNKTPSMYRGG